MKKSLIWSRFRLLSWLMGNRQAKKERARRQSRIRSRGFERLEERELFAVVVTANTANINPDVSAIIISGSGFDPIVSNNTVTFNNSAAGTVISASPTQLTVQFSTAPDDAGSLTAVVATTTENSGAPVQVATVVPKVTASLANLAANASTITINGDGFDETAGNNILTFTNGAAGTVTAATDTQLTVNITTPPTAAGALSVTVTTNSVPSVSPVQVATVVPVITSSTTGLAANATSMTISGFGFSSTPGNNLVDFNGLAVGTVTASSATSLTVSFSTPPRTAGVLTALVTTNGVTNSGAAVQVATVTPVITSSSANLAANASSITISGFGFDINAANNTVTFNNGAVGTVTSATATTLNVNLTTKPTAAGNLTAQVSTNSVSNGSAVNVATVTPVVTNRTVAIAANAATVTIQGFGFSTTPGNNTVALNNSAVGTVTSATATTLTVTFSTNPATAGNLTAVVTTNSVPSGSAVQVATVTPVVTSNSAAIAANAATVTINGSGFDAATPGNNVVVMNNGAVGTVTGATATTLTVTFGTNPTVAGNLTAVVTTGGVSSGTAVQIAAVRPVVTSSTSNLAADASTITIAGTAFSPTAANNSVSFNNGAVGTVTAATSTSLTVTFSTKPTIAGSLTAVVTSNGINSGSAVQVANVTPVVTASTATIAADATTVAISGFGFDTTPGNNTVALNNGAVGTVTAASATSLTVTFSTNPTAAGSLTAIVTTSSLTSGSAVQIANVRPVITSSTADLAANAATMTIAGVGFSTTPGNNTVVFNNGATGTVTAATSTSLTVTFGVKPTSAGPLTAIVTTNSVANGTAVQVAKVLPVVTSSTANLAANATTVTIAGFGFDTTATDNVITFNNGAAGTVTSATPTTLIVTLSTLPTMAGTLTSVVTTDSIVSGAPVQVATVIPAVTANPTGLITASANTITINGFGFDPTPGNNTVTFDNGATGNVTAASSTSLTVTFVNKPSEAGALNASVSTNTISSGSAVQVTGVSPVVTANVGSMLNANASQILIVGLGFDTTAGNNTVVFDSGATGTVVSATSTLLAVNFDTAPAAGDLKAIVTTNGINNGSAIQVGTARPVVTSATTGLAANANTVTINGFGFDLTAANNTVAFNNGAVGTVTSATATQLVVTFSTKPTSAGSLTALVTSNSVAGVAAVQVATVTPVVTTNDDAVAANASTVVIDGFGFDPTPANNSVVFNNGAIGNVTSATATSLTVTFSKKPTSAGSLTAIVTSNGENSGSAVEVGTLAPVVTANSGNQIAANGTSITIIGQGFDPTAGNNVVTFNNGAVGTVDSATATSLNITLSTPPTTAGSLTAIVEVNGVDSGAAVQVATIVPVVTSSNNDLLANADTITINGFGFDTNAANTSVVFNNGAVGTVTAATATTLTVTFSTKPQAAGDLTVVVTSNSASSGAPIKVATVKPIITSSTTDLAANASTVVINGFGFSSTPEDNLVTLSNGAVGTVTSASNTTLTVTFSSKPDTVGSITASVTSNALSSGSAVQIGNVLPVVTAVTDNLAANATSITIQGYAFDTTAADNTVVFNNGAVGTVTAATSTTLTVTLSTSPTTAGSLTAIVTNNSVSSSSAVQVATVVPVVTSSTSNLAANADTITISGFGFSTTAGDNTVTFNNGAVGAVTAATATSLTVTFSTKPTTAGQLTAIVATNAISSGAAVQVATITPVVTSATTSVAANATTVVINGFGFSTTPVLNTVTLNNSAVGVVTSATATSLTVTYSTKPAAGGSLTAIVDVNGSNSGSAVQVARVTPVVNANAGLTIAADASTVVINGVGFDTTPGNNTVAFNNGAVGSVTSASSTAITVTFSTKPTTAGSLTAVVTTNSSDSGSAAQIATVAPVVTSAVGSLAINGTTVTINGFGFSPTAANNTVTFNNGAVGAVTAATATSLTVALSTAPNAVGSLTAIVTTNSQTSGSAVQVATVKPVVTANTTSQGINADTVTINGFGFSTTPSQNTVVLNNGAVGTVTAATATALTVTLSVKPTAAGSLTAVVTTSGQSSGSAVQVSSSIPVITSSSTSRGASDSTLLIYGFGFDTTASNNTVTLSNGAVGTVTSATSTMLTVTYSTKPKAGNLTAQATVNGIGNGSAVQVATVAPVVTSSTAALGANASTVTINGFGFDTVAANNTVTFNNGAVGTITTATATSLLVTFSTKPTSMGSLTAIVTSNSVSSGSAVQVAAVGPTVTSSTANLLLTAATMTINGFGFSTTPGNNTVVFNNGAVGTVTAATATALTVTFSTNPGAGALTATVTVNSFSSGAAVQVASVRPTVTQTTTEVLATASTVTITGNGFSTTPADNTVVFSNGAIGSVTAATATSLTVTYSKKPWAGALTATVTTRGVASASAVQIAAVKPVVTASETNLALNGTTLVITGVGFDPTRTNNTVSFVGGPIGTVSAATATELTVTLTTRPTAVGVLNASVTTNSRSSGTAVKVANVVSNATAPTVTSSSTNLAANAATITIAGTNFSTTVAENVVTFSNGAVGSVTAATSTSLTVTFSTAPRAGNLTAVVAVNGVTSGSAVQVASVIPVVTSSTTAQGAATTSLTINGFGFDTTAANNTVRLSNGAVARVSAATATSLTLVLTTRPTSVGNLTAIVTTNSRTSGAAVQVATVVPTVNASTTAQSITANTVVITGTGFSSVAGNNTVTFNNGAVGTVTTATTTSLTVTFSTKPTVAGNLTATVTTSSQSSGTAVQVAVVRPVVTQSSSSLALGTTTMTIAGTGFSTTAGNNTVVFSNGAVGTVTAATATSLSISFSTVPTAGRLTAIVTTNGVSSGSPVQVATLTPTVTSSTTNLAANASTVTITGTGFSATAANNTVAFNNGAVGTVTAATTTSLTVTFTTQPTSAGSLTAIVTSGGVTSGSAVQIATVIPVVTSRTNGLAINANGMVINGFGFSSTLANNSVVFSNGAIGTVTAATPTALTVTFGTRPSSLGNLTAVVTTNSNSSGSAVQVATVSPAVTRVTTSISSTAPTVTITGAGFSATAGNNTVVFNNGAVGTVTAATSTSLTVTFSTNPAAGNLTAVVTTDGTSSGAAIQVARVTPTVTSDNSSLSNAATTITIAGAGFSTTAANNRVTFNNGAIGTVSAATATSLTVTFSTKPAAGNLTAVVTTNGVGSGAAVQVATVPVSVTNTTTSLNANSGSVTITGTGFSSTPGNNTVVFNNGVVGAVTAASATSLTVLLSARPSISGSLTAIVTTNGVNSGSAVQIAEVRPVVTARTTNLALAATTVTINGFGFSTTPGNNTVTFNNGAVGTVTSSTATSLVVTFSTNPLAAGSLTAIVTSEGVSSGSAIQVATMV